MLIDSLTPSPIRSSQLSSSISSAGGVALHSPEKVNLTSRYKKKGRVVVNELDEFYKLAQEDFDSCKPLEWLGRWSQFPNLYHLVCHTFSVDRVLQTVENGVYSTRKHWLLCLGHVSGSRTKGLEPACNPSSARTSLMRQIVIPNIVYIASMVDTGNYEAGATNALVIVQSEWAADSWYRAAQATPTGKFCKQLLTQRSTVLRKNFSSQRL